METNELSPEVLSAFEQFDQEGKDVTLKTISGFLNARLSVATLEQANPATRIINKQAYNATKLSFPHAMSPEEEIEKLRTAKDLTNNAGRTAAFEWFDKGIPIVEGIIRSQQRMGIQYSRMHQARLITMKAAAKLLR